MIFILFFKNHIVVVKLMNFYLLLASFFYLERLKSVTEHDDLISSIVKTQDGSQIITSSYDNSIVVSETETLRLLSRIPEAHTDIIYNIAVSDKNQNILISAANDGFVSLWDLRTIRQSNSSHNCKFSFASILFKICKN